MYTLHIHVKRRTTTVTHKEKEEKRQQEEKKDDEINLYIVCYVYLKCCLIYYTSRYILCTRNIPDHVVIRMLVLEEKKKCVEGVSLSLFLSHIHIDEIWVREFVSKGVFSAMAYLYNYILEFGIESFRITGYVPMRIYTGCEEWRDWLWNVPNIRFSIFVLFDVSSQDEWDGEGATRGNFFKACNSFFVDDKGILEGKNGEIPCLRIFNIFYKTLLGALEQNFRR